MGFDRPGITPAAKPRKKVVRKAGGVAGVIAAATPKPPPVTRRQVTRAVAGAPVRARRGVGGVAGAIPTQAKADTGDILAGPSRVSRAEARRSILASFDPASGETTLQGVLAGRRGSPREIADAVFRNAELTHGKSWDLARVQRAKREVTAQIAKSNTQTRKEASIGAPVLKVLDQTTRPLHAIAGAADAAITDKSVPRAALRGIENKDRTTYSTVLKHLGAPKIIRTPAGFVLDVFGDPTTYVTFGAATAVREAATVAAKEGGVVAARAAARAAAGAAPKGLVVKVAGHEVPVVRKVTGHTVGRAAAATGRTKVARAVKRVAADVNPNIAPEGVAKADWQAGTAAARRARATTATARRAAEAKAVALRKSMGKDDMAVTHAIETKTIGSLPTHLQPAARELDRLYRQMDATEKAAGIKGGSIGALQPKAIPKRVADPVAVRRQRDAAVVRRHHVENGRPSTAAVADAYHGLQRPRQGTHLANVKVTAHPDGRTAIRATVRHGDEDVGRITRLFDARTGRVSMESIKVAAEHRAKGVAAQLNALEESALAAAGVRHLDAMPLTRAGHIVAERAGYRPAKDPGVVSKSLVVKGGAKRAARQAVRDADIAVAREQSAAAAERVAIKQATAHNARIAGAPKAYVPHKTVESITGKPPKALRGSVGKRKIAPGARKARKVEGTLTAKVAAEPGKYSQDAALVYANRAAESGKAVAQADLNRHLAALGRPYKAGETVPDPKLEGVFRLDGSDLPEVTGAALKRLHRDGPAPGERVVILHRELVKHAHAQSGGAIAGTTSGRVYDRIQGGFKQVATLTPGFHVRNLVGDTQNAYLAQSGLRLPGNMARSGRVLRAVKREEEAQRTLGATAKPVKGVLAGRGGVKIDGRKMTYEELADEATRVGAIRQGYTGRDITDQLATRAARGSAIKKVSGDTRRGHAARAVKRTLQSREDLPRLATYISARRAGMSPEAAAAYEMKYHFDYANLTEFERKVARRALPFYTFSSRNIPLQMKAVLTNPGKYANYEKLREEAAIAVGLQPGWEGDLTPWEQRNAPIPVRIKGHLYTISMGLPLTDLNEFPTTADALKLATEQASKLGSLVTPLLKDPVEIYANRSLFFRDDIKRSTAPLVPAPTWTKDLPDSWKRKLGVVDDLIDKRTGKKIMGWDAWSNYAAHVVPGLPALGVKLSGPTDRTGHDRAQTAIGATGVKVTPVNPVAVKVNDLYDELARIQTQLGALSQRGIKAGVAERDALNARARVIEQQIYQASTAVIKPTQGRPRRVRQAAPSYGGTGGLGSGGSGGTGGLSSGGLGAP